MWNPIETAPTDGTVIVVMTKGGYFLAARWDVFDDPIGGWQAAVSDRHPPCWSAGVCWASNDDEEPSDPPMLWAPAPVPAPL